MLRLQLAGARVVRAGALCCSAALAALAVPTPARAGATTTATSGPAAPGPQLSWQAPDGCPDQEAVASRLRDTLGAELSSFGQHWQVRGQVQRAADGQWRLLLELREPEQPPAAAARQRILHARHCADLVEAAAVAVALALGDAQEVAASSSPRPSAPAPPVNTPPAPSTPPGLDLAAAGTAPLERTALPSTLNASLEALLDTASVSGVALGGSLALGGWLGDWGLSAHGLWLPAREAAIGAGQGAEFSLLAAGARLCYRAWGNARGLGLAACGGLELGTFTARSHGLVAAGRVSDTWLAPGVGLDVRGKLLGYLAARSRVELLAPLRRQTYRVDLIEPIHEIPALTVRWSVGFEADVALP